MPKTDHNYADRFEAIQNEHQQKLEDLGEDVRRNLVAPACRKYRLTFTSGMGDYFFTSGSDGHIHDCTSAREAGFPGLCPIFEVLDLEISRGFYLGHYVGDVR